MLRPPTSDEIIAHLREALRSYADPDNWSGAVFPDKSDVSRDDCSGLFRRHGELARQALNYNEGVRIPVRKE